MPNIALISGIAWDHINVFPTFEIYVEQFKIFTDLIVSGGSLVYFENDEHLSTIAKNSKNQIQKFAYNTHPHVIVDNVTYLVSDNKKFKIEIFGEHNLQNISGAKQVCKQLGLSDEQFYSAITTFKGAAKRLQLLGNKENTHVYLDFAHSPSKLMATTDALKKQYPNRKLVACMELHTFSSLTEEFLKEYKGTMKNADEAIVYFNPHTIQHKKLKEITPEQVKESFGGNNIKIYTDAEKLTSDLLQMSWSNKNLLLMTSGNFSGINFKDFATKILEKS
jgi:UDP-N-acetylmuramate: L-alanyl-gamma-D-glutamyl-meso-diaminopimelate ligase